MSSPQYETWSREELITRLRQLDRKLASVESHNRVVLPQRPEPRKKIDFASYPRRKIALKFCYSGWEYNGLVFQGDKTRLPTVESTLYNALAECRLIDGAAGPRACGWERCGRTDVGVSSAAQVVSLWVRSNIGQGETSSQPIEGPSRPSMDLVGNTQEITDSDFPPPESDAELPQLDTEIETNPSAPMPKGDKELRYVTILNRILPPSIRILAWSPVSTSFSSRYNCQYRHYKYFFSPDGLDLDAMRDAAERLVGEHDFRNLSKLDPAKQTTMFRRKIIRADISPASVRASNDGDVTTNRPHMCVLDLVGTAFLYNQVRHIMAILFLVGAGLEPPSVVTALLNADPKRPESPFREGEAPPELVTCRPEYQIADPLPLVLWECGYDEEDVKWRTDSGNGGSDSSILYNQLSSIHTRSLVYSMIDATFLQAASKFHPPRPNPFPLDISSRVDFLRKNPSMILNVPLGGGIVRRAAANTYAPLLRRKRLEHVDIVNERWRNGKGERRAARRAETAAADNDDDE